MSRGFVTIATGKERYFKLAKNLLYSYRKFASVKYPFAIICDKINHYTEEFDEVILLKKAHCNYLDKLQLYDYLPYDETIFIDADSLAYGDWINGGILFIRPMIFHFSDMHGQIWIPGGAGSFQRGVNEYQDKVTFIPDFNGGVYYMRRGETCKEVFKLANYFSSHFHQYQFNGFTTPADEPVWHWLWQL